MRTLNQDIQWYRGVLREWQDGTADKERGNPAYMKGMEAIAACAMHFSALQEELHSAEAEEGAQCDLPQYSCI